MLTVMPALTCHGVLDSAHDCAISCPLSAVLCLLLDILNLCNCTYERLEMQVKMGIMAGRVVPAP